MATTKKALAPAAEKEAKPVKAAAVKKLAVEAVAKAEGKAPAKASAVAPAAAKASVLNLVPPVKAKAPAKKKAVGTVWHEVDPEKRANYIEVAAFYIAERRGFAPGDPEQDYLQAAAEIDRMIAAGHFSK